MMHLSDRRRVELALPANLMFRMVSQCVEASVRTDDDKEILAQFQRAAIEPLSGLSRAEMFRVARRVERAADVVMAEIKGHAHATAFLALTLWVKGMLDDGTLELIEGSDFDMAIEAVIATLEDAPDVVLQVDRSATKAEIRISGALANAGYYPGRAICQNGTLVGGSSAKSTVPATTVARTAKMATQRSSGEEIGKQRMEAAE